MEIRRTEDHENIGALVSVRAKVLIRSSPSGDGEVRLESVRVELAMEDDLFFHLFHQVSEQDFKSVQARQKLMKVLSPELLPPGASAGE